VRTERQFSELAAQKSREINELAKRLADQQFVPVVDEDLVQEWLHNPEKSAGTRQNRRVVEPLIRRLPPVSKSS
jgi:hypothetical protein